MRICVRSTTEENLSLLLSPLCPQSAGSGFSDAGQGLCALGLLDFSKQSPMFPGFLPLHSWTTEAPLPYPRLNDHPSMALASVEAPEVLFRKLDPSVT